MTAWTTRRGKPNLPGESAPVSPTLLYHKWHAYDRGPDPWATKDSRLEFLDRVAGLANRALAGYPAWHERYFEALDALGVELGVERIDALGVERIETVLRAKTVWRLIAGFATNPALETGLSLHLLHGFPYLPGSAVRGLARRVAESKLTAMREFWFELAEPPPEEEISQFLAEAERLQAILGSLAVDPPASGVDPGWRTPRELLTRLHTLLGKDPASDILRRRIDSLRNGHTGGLVTFFDAVPAPEERDLLKTDLLNPHYPEFYRQSGKVPPSDDQNPTPVYFLAIRDGAVFEFPFSLAEWPRSEPRDEAERQRVAALGATPRAQVIQEVRDWLTDGLKSWGAGAKTAAGYGYFEILASAESEPRP